MESCCCPMPLRFVQVKPGETRSILIPVHSGSTTLASVTAWSAALDAGSIGPKTCDEGNPGRRQLTVGIMPPSTLRFAPVMKSAPELARKATAWAISAGEPMRPAGSLISFT